MADTDGPNDVEESSLRIVHNKEGDLPVEWTTDRTGSNDEEESLLSFGSGDELGDEFEDVEFEGDDENEEETIENRTDNLEGSVDPSCSTSETTNLKKGKKSKSKKRRRANSVHLDPTKRRRIRRILREDELEKETLTAQMEEKERLRRLELQKSLATEASGACPSNDVAPNTSISPCNLIADHSLSPLLVDFRQKSKDQSQVIVIDSEDDDNDDNSVNDDEFLCNRVVEVISSDSNSEVDISESETDESGTDENNAGLYSHDMYNQPDSQGRVVVNVNHPAIEEDIFLAPQIAKRVKPHQIGGIRFLYDNLVETLARHKVSSGFGCILAHCMGLGKTLQVIAFIDIFLQHTTAKKVLCIVPINTIQNWLTEFNMWLPSKPAVNENEEVNNTEASDQVRHRPFNVHLLGDNQKTTLARAKVIGEWNSDGGVLLMGYELYRILALSTPCMASNKCAPPKKKKLSSQATTSSQEPEIIDLDEEEKHMDFLIGIQKALCKPGPDLVICDEGHRIKNNHANISYALKKIRTRRRVVLTGYPLQNNLVEYWCMVDFVRPNFLGTRHEFCNMFERPIVNGQCSDSTPADVRLMRFRAHVLHSLLEGFVQRRSQSILMKCLPPKEEHIILVKMSPIQLQLYNAYIDFLLKSVGYVNPIKGFHTCMKIWNHPDVFFSSLEAKTEGKRNESPLTLLDNDVDNGACLPSVASLPSYFQSSSVQDLGLVFSNTDWAKEIMKDYQPFIVEQGGKMVLLVEIMEESFRLGEKILLFSQSLSTLSVIEDFLSRWVIPFFPGRPIQSDPPTTWARNKSYFRLDGSTSAQERERLINAFNAPDNKDVILFMLSTRAGCLGVNLIGASRVIVFDASWNPCHDVQAVCRVYRYGQEKPCHIYRLISTGTMEKKIYDRQVSKQGVANRVVDELNPEANFSKQEIMSLICEKEPDIPSQDVSAAAEDFSDTVLTRICKNCTKWISKVPFKHESLLVDKRELKLTREEKREAKKGYEIEKRMAIHGGRYYPSLAPQAQSSARVLPTTSEDVKRPVVTVNPMQTFPSITTQQYYQPPLIPWTTMLRDGVQFATLSANMTNSPISVTPNLPYAVMRNTAAMATNIPLSIAAGMPLSMAANGPIVMAANMNVGMAANMPIPIAPQMAYPMAATLSRCIATNSSLSLGQESLNSGIDGPVAMQTTVPVDGPSVAMTGLSGSIPFSVPSVPLLTGERKRAKEVVTIDLDELPSPPPEILMQNGSQEIDKAESSNSNQSVPKEDVLPRTGVAVESRDRKQTEAMATNPDEDTEESMAAEANQTNASQETDSSISSAVLQNLLNARGGLRAAAISAEQEPAAVQAPSSSSQAPSSSSQAPSSSSQAPNSSSQDPDSSSQDHDKPDEQTLRSTVPDPGPESPTEGSSPKS